MGLLHKDLISIHDLTVGEVATILDVAKKLKKKQMIYFAMNYRNI